MKYLIINGPNLNLLGVRQPDIYGHRTMQDILDDAAADHPDIEIHYLQSNSEGDIVTALQHAGYPADDEPRYDGIVLNAGAYTHTSLAIADAIAAIPTPVIEVHLSNIAAREPIRHHSMLTPMCRGIIAGLGDNVYTLALTALKKLQK